VTNAKREFTILAAISISLMFAWNLYDYRTTIFGGENALAAAASHQASLSVTVAQSITLTQTAGGSVAFGTLNPGTKVTGSTQLTVLTNGVGMNITAGRQRSISNVTLASNASPTIAQNQISDTTGGIDVFNGISNCSTVSSKPQVWANGTSTGLGFSNYSFDGGGAKSTTCWGSGSTSSDANNKYAALQASASAASFLSSTGYSSTGTNTYVAYALDVGTTQKATIYNGGVVFTATSTP
jgi:hypothetical protein